MTLRLYGRCDPHAMLVGRFPGEVHGPVAGAVPISSPDTSGIRIHTRSSPAISPAGWTWPCSWCRFMVNALTDDGLIRQARAIVGCQASWAPAHAASSASRPPAAAHLDADTELGT